MTARDVLLALDQALLAACIPALVEAALDQPNPTPALRLAVRRVQAAAQSEAEHGLAAAVSVA